MSLRNRSSRFIKFRGNDIVQAIPDDLRGSEIEEETKLIIKCVHDLKFKDRREEALCELSK